MSTGILQLKFDELELGRLYYKACDFDLAIVSLEGALLRAETNQDWNQWAQMLSFLMRMRVERLEFEQLEILRARLGQAQASGQITEISALEYVVGVSKLYAGEIDSAEIHFQKAHLLGKNLRETSQALFGQAAVLSQRRQFPETLSLLENFEGFLEGSESLRDLQIAGLLLKVVCYREMEQMNEALIVLEAAEKLCHLDQNFYMVINSIFMRATIHQKARRWPAALECFDLCEPLLRERDLKHLKSQISSRRQQIEAEMLTPRKIIELRRDVHVQTLSSERGELDCTGQVLLLRLLDFIAAKPGASRSKEEIVQTLWGEEYHPLRHDNKVYVTIKRLRKLLEQDVESPKILLKGPDGYFFNSAYEYQVTGASA